jgi:predicted MFS family arabinose efflux permease
MNASVRFIVWGTMPLGAALGGVFGTAIGIRETLWVSVIGSWCAGLFVFFSPLRRMRDVEIHGAYSERSVDAESVPVE